MENFAIVACFRLTAQQLAAVRKSLAAYRPSLVVANNGDRCVASCSGRYDGRAFELAVWGASPEPRYTVRAPGMTAWWQGNNKRTALKALALAQRQGIDAAIY